jgi:hypothetical protein
VKRGVPITFELSRVNAAQHNSYRDRNGNWVVQDICSTVTLRPKHGHKFQVLIYRSVEGMKAYLSGNGVESGTGDITDNHSQEAWEEIFAQATAGKVLLGRVPKIEREILI